MRVALLIVLGSLSLVAAACAEPQAPAPVQLYPNADASGAPILAVFEGRVPCLGANCEKTKVALVFYQGDASQTYWLAMVDVGGGDDTRRIAQGTWSAATGVEGYPQAPVYQLDANAPQVLRRLWRAGADVLLPLDEAMRPRAGNASWGYMLSRVR
ncbi:MAG: hypothetical protein JNK07_13130 [Alphaproteobacteria bacterium]|nr:hypothetical protein [Alphaproteobacteria bacterium]